MDAVRAAGRSVWRTIGILVIAVVVVASGAAAVVTLAQQHATENKTYFSPVAAIDIDAGSAEVRIEAGPPDRTTVQTTAAWTLARPVVNQSMHDRTLRISVRCRTFPRALHCAAVVTVRVGGGVSVRSSGTSGSFSASGLSGDVHAETGSGEIQLERLSGAVWAQATSGQIVGHGLTSPTVRAAATSGQVILSLAGPPESVALTSTSGQLMLSLPTDGTRYRVTAHTTSGSLDVNPTISDDASQRRVDITTTSGSAQVTVSPT
ncbi:DUF4097 family beta strand repeat-containing protein [Kitasatospora sp. NPDC059571]|uniref:DUF4097 family beta strand repeat-containing protein n=1 Tax=Kitasatospora sp. NPDC059571 TaxID=3346871 RepID=UPI0036A0858A